MTSQKNLINFSDKIFIAGATGLVGSSLKKLFIEKGYGNIDKRGIILSPSRKELDLANSLEVENWFKKNNPDIVVIAAAKVGGIIANSNNPVNFLLENLKIQNNIIESSWKNGVRRLLFLGSSCIYPKESIQPIKEEYLLNNSLEKTNEAYAIAKITGLKLCDYLRRQYKFDAFSLMPSNLYGPGDNYNLQNSHVLPALIYKFHKASITNQRELTCWGTGKPLREFLFVNDLANACIFALENWDFEKDIFPTDNNKNKLSWINIGSKEEITIFDLAKKIAKLTNYKGIINWDQSKPDGTFRKKLDISNATSLGWESKTTLDQGLKITYQNFLKNYSTKKLKK